MKTEVSQAVEVFRPITVTLVLESAEEAAALKMLADNYETVCEYVTPTIQKERAMRSILIPLNAKLQACGLFK